MTGRTTAPSIRDEHHHLDLQQVKAVQELERHGYVAEPQPSGSLGGVICRHAVAPSLLVGDDGRVEVLGGQPARHALAPSPPQNRIRWRRTLLFLALLGLVTFLGLLAVGIVVG